MDKKIKADWVNALRSGEYEQGRGRLTRADEQGKVRYCCLGVLCDLAVKAGVDVSVIQYDDYLSYDGESATLPDIVQEWAGLQDENPMMETGPFQINGDERSHAALAELNDGIADAIEQHDFTQIADVIEAQL